MKKIFFPDVNIVYQDSNIIIPTLNGLRGLAICFVIAFHFFNFQFGWSGVDLFFVLSGFLITGKLIESKGASDFLKNFWIRRILRIFPLYYLVLVLIILPKIFLNLNTIGDPSWTYWLYLQNWNFVYLGSFPNVKGTINHFWSLAVEEQFYLLFPFIIKYCKLKFLPAVLILSIVVANLTRYYFWKHTNIGYYVFTFSRIDALAIGALLAYQIRYNCALVEKIVVPIFYLSLAIIITIILRSSANNENPYFAYVGLTVVSVFYSTLIVFCISVFKYNFFNALFCNRLLIYLGKISYGLYIFHWILYVFISPVLFGNIGRVTHQKDLAGTLVAIVILGLTILVSHISYFVFEKRFLQLKVHMFRNKLTHQEKFTSI